MNLMQYMIRDFGVYYPNENSMDPEFLDVDPGLMRVRLNDGTTGYFNNMDFLFKVVYRNGDDAEKAWKKAFAILLDYRMTMKCMSQMELSEATGISQASLSGYLNERRIPTVIAIAKIAKAVGVPTSFFTDCLMDIFL